MCDYCPMSKKILLVEDDKTTILLLHKFIEDLGYHIVKTVATGEEAIREVIKTSPDLVLMDIVLGGEIDGIDTTRQINEGYRNPVIYIPSSTDSDTRKRALATNPAAYIVKPADKKELKSAIDLALLRHEMEEKLKDSELRFFTILNSIGDAVFVMDTADHITYVNPIAERITETTINKLIGRRFTDVRNLQYDGVYSGLDAAAEDIFFNYFISKSGKKEPGDLRL